MATMECSFSSTWLLTCGGGQVVLEEAELGRGRVYHRILYEWGGGGPTFEEGEWPAAAMVEW
jgi:hypothetical protein